MAYQVKFQREKRGQSCTFVGKIFGAKAEEVVEVEEKERYQASFSTFFQQPDQVRE